MAMTKICKVNDIPKNGMKGFEINGRKIFIANVNENYYCNDSHCTHRGAPLEDGDLNRNVVTCPWHGAEFDVTTGANLSPPAPAPVRHNKIEIKGDEIWADL